jgi:hypothetical protein
MKDKLQEANQALLEGDRDGVLELLHGENPSSSMALWLRANSVKEDGERIKLLSQLVDMDPPYSLLAKEILSREIDYKNQLDEPPDYQFWKQPTWSKRFEKMYMYRMWMIGGLLLLLFGIFGIIINSRYEKQFQQEVIMVQTTQTAQAFLAGSQSAQYNEGIVTIAGIQDPVDILDRAVTSGEISNNSFVIIEPTEGARFVAVLINFQCLENICSNPPEARLSLLLQDGKTTNFYDYSSHYFFVDEPPDPVRDRLSNGRSLNLWFVFEVSRNTAPIALLVSTLNGEESLIVAWPVR